MILVVIITLLNLAPIGLTVDAHPGLSDPLAVTVHSTIKIVGDSNFTLANGVVAGDGSSLDPYIIENWSINASSKVGIWVWNTTKSFVIRNCYVYDGRNKGWDGVLLWNATNGSVTDSYFKNDNSGVDVYYSSHISVSNVSITKSRSWGLVLNKAHYNTVANVSTGFGSDDGFYVTDADHDLFTDCTSFNNTGHGIVDGGSNNTYLDNQIYNNTGTGIAIGASDIRLSGNAVHDNHDGISIAGGSRLVVEGNNISKNKWDALYLDTTSYVKILGNDINDNGNGVILSYGDHNTIIGNTIKRNGGGMVVFGSLQNTLYDNVMSGNDQNFGVYSGFIGTGTNIIPTNNTVDGKPIYFWYKQAHKTVPADAGYVALLECNYITMKGLVMARNLQGIMMESSNDISVENNTIRDVGNGIEDYDSTVRFVNNEVLNASLGINLYMTSGVYLGGNHIQQSWMGMYLYNCQRTTIVDNTLDRFPRRSWDEGIAIRVWFSGQTNISHNTIYDGDNNGIELYGSQHTWIRWNDIHNFTYKGIEDYGTPCDIENNTVYNNGDGIYVYDPNGGGVFDNMAFNNKGSGLYISDAIGDQVANNILQSNVNGLFISSYTDRTIFNGNVIIGNENGLVDYAFKENNLIYDNYLNNTNNSGGDAVTDVWNTTKSPGRNIVDGPFIGGNYWSDYNGTDLNGDFIGDTKLPWGHGDSLPLIPCPPLLDNTNGTPATGRSFTFNATAYYKVGVANVTVEYWYGNGSGGHSETPMALVSGTRIDGRYSVSVTVPPGARTLGFFMVAKSAKSAVAATPARQLAVIDVLDPMIKDTSGSPRTGELFEPNLSVSDNWEVKDYNLSYQFDGWNWTTLNSTDIAAGIAVPPTAHELHYMINATDSSNNTAGLAVDKEVMDVIAPTLVNYSADPRTGETMTFACNATDNWGVINVQLSYRFNGPAVPVDMTRNSSAYITEIEVPVDATVMNFTITVFDISGLTASLERNIAVRDIIGPIIVETPGTPTTGEEYTVSASMTDIIDGPIHNGILDYWFDSSTPVRVNFDGVFGIKVPGYAHYLNYTIWCTDRSRNPGHLNRSLVVIDDRPPTVADASQSTAEVGKAYNFSVAVVDNRDIKTVYVEYWFEGQRSKLNLVLSGSYYIGVITVPVGAKTLHYIVHAEDGSGNKADMLERDLTVQYPAPPPHKLTNQNAWAVPMLLLGLIVAVLILVTLVLWKRGGRELEPHRTGAIEIDASEE